MKQAFSLVELLVVVIIVATIYTLAFNTTITEILNTKNDRIEIDSIKTAIFERVENKNSKIDLACKNDTMECFLFENDSYLDIKYELTQRLSDYYIDKYDQATLKQHIKYNIDDFYFIPDFVYTIYPNGANSDNLAELEDGSFAYFDPYFNSVKILPNSVDAIRYAHKFEYMPHQIGISNE